MIKIIKEGTINRIECDYCGALLSYDINDIQKENEKEHWPCYSLVKYIICPQCQNKIILEGIR